MEVAGFSERYTFLQNTSVYHNSVREAIYKIIHESLLSWKPETSQVFIVLSFNIFLGVNLTAFIKFVFHMKVKIADN
jgi:hypothetical protein